LEKSAGKRSKTKTKNKNKKQKKLGKMEKNTVVQLRAMLKAKGLPIRGRKQQLIDRLAEHSTKREREEEGKNDVENSIKRQRTKDGKALVDFSNVMAYVNQSDEDSLMPPASANSEVPAKKNFKRVASIADFSNVMAILNQSDDDSFSSFSQRRGGGDDDGRQESKNEQKNNDNEQKNEKRAARSLLTAHQREKRRERHGGVPAMYCDLDDDLTMGPRAFSFTDSQDSLSMAGKPEPPQQRRRVYPHLTWDDSKASSPHRLSSSDDSSSKAAANGIDLSRSDTLESIGELADHATLVKITTSEKAANTTNVKSLWKRVLDE
jgi:SAP domain